MKELRTLSTTIVLGYWAVLYVGHLQGLQPWGQGWLFQWMLVAVFMAPAVIALAGVLTLSGIVAGRANLLSGLGLLLVSSVAFLAFPYVNGHFRARAAARVAHETFPLTAAIRAYATTHGGPPSELASLVPGFLPRIPATGMGAYPDFEYQVGTASPGDEEWALVIRMTRGFAKWDLMIYLPSGRYPASGWGGKLERVGDWAYVHD